MAQILDIYRMVKIVNKLAKQEEKDNRQDQDWIYQSGGYPLGTPLTSTVNRSFKKKYKWLSDRRRYLALTKAIEGGYLKEVFKQEGGNISLHVIQIESRGWAILNRTLFAILPKGLLLEWTKENGSFNNLVVAAMGGIVVGSVSAAAAIISLYKR